MFLVIHMDIQHGAHTSGSAAFRAQLCFLWDVRKDCSIAVGIFCTSGTICFSLSLLFVTAMPLSLFFCFALRRKQANSSDPDVDFPSHSHVMQVVKSRLQEDLLRKGEKKGVKNKHNMEAMHLESVPVWQRYINWACTHLNFHKYTHILCIYWKFFWRSWEMFSNEHLCSSSATSDTLTPVSLGPLVHSCPWLLG